MPAHLPACTWASGASYLHWTTGQATLKPTLFTSPDLHRTPCSICWPGMWQHALPALPSTLALRTALQPPLAW